MCGWQAFSLRSPAFNDHDRIPSRHAHDRDNVSPALEWSGAPEGVTELVLLCEDPDAPGGAFLHWGQRRRVALLHIWAGRPR